MPLVPLPRSGFRSTDSRFGFSYCISKDAAVLCNQDGELYVNASCRIRTVLLIIARTWRERA